MIMAGMIRAGSQDWRKREDALDEEGNPLLEFQVMRHSSLHPLSS